MWNSTQWLFAKMTSPMFVNAHTYCCVVLVVTVLMSSPFALISFALMPSPLSPSPSPLCFWPYALPWPDWCPHPYALDLVDALALIMPLTWFPRPSVDLMMPLTWFPHRYALDLMPSPSCRRPDSLTWCHHPYAVDPRPGALDLSNNN